MSLSPRPLCATLALTCAAALSACDSAPSAAAAAPPAPTVLAPSAVALAETHGLRAFKVSLPAGPLSDGAPAYTSQWQVAGSAGLREVYVDYSREGGVEVYGLADGADSGTLTLYRRERSAVPAFEVPIKLAAAEPAGQEMLAAWADARIHGLQRYARIDEGGLLPAMLQISGRVHGARGGYYTASGRRRGPGAQASVFSLFSGEAAIQETLQMELLQDRGAPPATTKTLAELHGPQIASHPFAELIAAVEPGRLAAAELVPPERYFVHVGDVRKALDWLDGSADTGWELVGLTQGRFLAHDLVDRYLARLGLTRSEVQRWAELGVVRSVALFGPDLYLQHGSDLTVVLDTGTGAVPAALLRAVPGLGSASGTVTEIAAGTARAYRAWQGRWLVLSTSRSEAEAAMRLAREGGAGSLGASDEFRYMLSLLPGEDADGIFAYLSDPFIRAMVGPRVKIAQLRRQQARARLNLVTAASLLYQLDYGRRAVLSTLVQSGYVDQSWLGSWEGDRISLGADGVARSSLYGTLAAMTPLNRLEIDAVSASEASGYQSYVDNYSRYWSDSFDPVALRVRLGERVEIETVILPLIENSLYQMVSAGVGGEPVALNAPHLDPAPLTLLSFKLRREGLGALLSRGRSRLPSGNQLPPVESLLGESVHVAIYDNEPLVALGSSDLAGAFSGQFLAGGGRGSLLGFALLGSMLTQPSALVLETAPDLTLWQSEYLIRSLAAQIPWMSFGHSELARVGSGEVRKWVYTVELEGLIRLHFYLQQQGNHLIIANHQRDFSTTQPPRAAVTTNAALRTEFGAIERMAGVLDLHQQQSRADATLRSGAHLLPFLLLGADTPQQAALEHERVLGTRPVHPAGGEWHWQPALRLLESSLYGEPWRRQLPDPLRTGREAVGPFAGMERLELGLRFEDAGVRARLTLTPKPTRE